MRHTDSEYPTFNHWARDTWGLLTVSESSTYYKMLHERYCDCFQWIVCNVKKLLGSFKWNCPPSLSWLQKCEDRVAHETVHEPRVKSSFFHFTFTCIHTKRKNQHLMYMYHKRNYWLVSMFHISSTFHNQYIQDKSDSLRFKV